LSYCQKDKCVLHTIPLILVVHVRVGKASHIYHAM